MAYKETTGPWTGCRVLVLVWLTTKAALALVWSTKPHLPWPIHLTGSTKQTHALEMTGITTLQGFFSFISKEENPSQRQCAATTPLLPTSITLHKTAPNQSSALLANHKQVYPLPLCCCVSTSPMWTIHKKFSSPTPSIKPFRLTSIHKLGV